MIEKQCKNCSSKFEISDEDLEFYVKVSPIFGEKKCLVPEPTFCPSCRLQRRSVFRNEMKLYQRKCDLCKKNIISVYEDGMEFPVYCKECWWSDKWDSRDYGRNYDFSKSFFEQYKELQKVVPRVALLSAHCENCDYTHLADNNKDCYLIFLSGENENVYYGYWLNDNKNCVDIGLSGLSELSYELIDCDKCYNTKFAQNCGNCTDSWFLKNCNSCKNCAFCVNLRHKQYCYQNEQLTKEEYEKRMGEIDLSSYKNLLKYRQIFTEICKKFPVQYTEIENCEDCTGAYMFNSRRCHDSYYLIGCEDCRYCDHILKSTDSYDASVFGKPGELLYETNNVGLSSNRTLFTSFAYTLSDSMYCDHCFNTDHLFGCVSVRSHQNYLILNKTYSKREYEELVLKILEHMKSTGEYGEFFPKELSIFAYNETVAQQDMPITKEQAITAGFKWKDPNPKDYIKQTYNIPINIKDVPDNIINEVLACTECGKNYKIIKQELAFYRDRLLPIPFKCPDCRHMARMALRTPFKLWKRNCDKCGKEVESNYEPGRVEKIYCKDCYLKEMF